MDLYLAGEHTVKNGKLAVGTGQKILESFYYCKNNPWIPRLLPGLGDFLLDSGAFTFMQGAEHVDWDSYLAQYAEWINAHGVKKFFELDIDAVVGLKKVEQMRDRLAALTGIQPIPVWHLSRGRDYFVDMCKDYPYVAIGGLVGVKAVVKLDAAFPWFISTAHQHGAKIHGLGYTKINELRKYHFDSVDSTAWLYGNRAGYLYVFNGKEGKMDKMKTPPGKRLKSQDAALWNFNEWIKFQRYAERYL